MNLLVDIVLLCLLAVTALTVVYLKDLFAAVMLTSIYGLLSASLFVTLNAGDVAMTEAAVGAGVSPLLMLTTLAFVGRYEQKRRVRLQWMGLVLVALVGSLLLLGTLDMPPFTSSDAPAHQHVASRYIHQSGDEIGIPNMVASVLASYRGFDTLGEVAVIFTAGMGVLSLLLTMAPSSPANSGSGNASQPGGMSEHQVLRITGKILIPPILIFALYIQFHGDYGPGGGFQAGVVFAASIFLYTMLFGLDTAKKVINETLIQVLAAVGLLLYGCVGVLGLLNGKNYLDYTALAADPIAGQHLGILLVELGVGITVASVMILIFFSFSSFVAQGERR